MEENYTQKERDEKYNRWARKMPTTITISLPILLIIYIFFDSIAATSSNELLSLAKIILYFTTIISAFFFFGMFLLREIGTCLEKFKCFRIRESKILSDADDTLHPDTKQYIRELLEKTYNQGRKIKFNCKSNEDKKKLKDIINLIKEETRNSSILFEYQCIYGFFRNLTGGMLLNSILAIFLKIMYFISYSRESNSVCINKIIEKIDALKHPVSLNDVMTIYLIFSVVLTFVCWICTYRNSKRYVAKLFVTFEMTAIKKDVNDANT